ncbi:hypothetical protein AA0118_g9156 [Alternaria tenuissima]|uniref:Zn(2)-C6 fungal-type domain-containing protein n=2 Tax=Alternaria tenuissima TaxID=119927 RepID=A0AB37WB41_9PLEO|nr:c6 finger-like protein [Alternaria alternata]RYN21377.1 hypothetical protein AA0115_g9726 [Alternaria tenuissima]RYN54732.1 hypothetical protein AA0118_g9156 [Alternaria tenuissima]
MELNMPPKPEVEFDFNLPHGIDAEEPADVQQSVEPRHDAQMREPIMDAHTMNDQTLEQGFSDDDDAPQAFDRSWSGHQARKSSLTNNKSPRTDDDADEASPRGKRLCQSLFGGPTNEVEEDQFDDLFEEMPEEGLVDQADDLLETEVPRESIGNRLSGLDLEAQETEVHSSEQPLNLGFGFEESDRDSMSPRVSPALSDGDIVIPPDTQPAYGLRQGIERRAAYTYVDQDESGNFDPVNETQNKAQRLKMAKAAKAAKAARRLKRDQNRVSKEPVLKCIIKLRIANFGNVKNITDDQDNWPEDWSDIDSDVERELQEHRAFFRHNTPDRRMQLPIQDPRSEVEDLTGHPAARGCISCRVHGAECSMVTGGTYPCQYCCDLNQDCDPIITPTEKGRCKQCVDDSIDYCSFEDEPGQAICDHCAENEHICEALPPVGYRAERIVIDDVIYTEDRPYIQCTNCRREKKRCSLKKKTDKPPCKYCKKHNIGCTFYEIPKVVKEKKAKAKGPTEGDAPEVAIPDHDYFTKEDLEDLYNEDVYMESRSPTPEIEMEDEAGHKGTLTKIMTSFAHPIQFGSIENTSDCNFCELPIFGFVGHFEKEVHVIRWYGGHGYTEVGGGHAQDKEGVTTMCQICAIGRAQIMTCDEHDMQRISPDGTVLSFEEAWADLLEAAETSKEVQQQLQRWCSMCFSPAAFTCCARQASLFASEDDEMELDGCGLKLCARCESKLKKDFDGNSSLMAETLDHESKAKEEDEFSGDVTVVRADVGFISKKGMLMRNMELEADKGDL